MFKNEIVKMQKQLNGMINRHEDYEEIYRISIELDKLIVNYYKSQQIYNT